MPALRSPQGEVGSAKRAGIHDQNLKKIKNFSPSLTPFPTRSYLFSVSSETSVANVFFVPNAQLRPIVERRCFFRGTGFQPVTGVKHGRVLF